MTPTASHLSELIRLQTIVAHDAVVADIETGAHTVTIDGQRWHDIRPMVDPHEHAAPVIDMATIVLQYAAMIGLTIRHESQPYLVRIARRGQP